MILPFITAISRDVFETVPPVLKEAAYGIGATTFEVVGNVVIPYTRVGVIGGVMLALGRALGETMAVTFVIGNATKIQTSILAQGTTISAMIANQFADADPGLFTSSLLALGFILFVLTFIVLAPARWMLARHGTEGLKRHGQSLLRRAQRAQLDLDRALLWGDRVRPQRGSRSFWRPRVEGARGHVARRLHQGSPPPGVAGGLLNSIVGSIIRPASAS